MIAGGVVSTTETVCTALAEFPAASVDVHVIIVSPTEYDAGASLVIEVTPTESVASAIPISAVVETLVASTLILAGAVTTGEIVSTTVIV